MKAVLYAERDHKYLAELIMHLHIESICINSNAFDTIRILRIKRLMLLMSIDVLYQLECVEWHKDLFKMLQEGEPIIIPLWSCNWKNSFDRWKILPSELKRPIGHYRPAKRKMIYQQMANQLDADHDRGM